MHLMEGKHDKAFDFQLVEQLSQPNELSHLTWEITKAGVYMDCPPPPTNNSPRAAYLGFYGYHKNALL